MLFLTIVHSLALTAPAPTKLAQVPENGLLGLEESNNDMSFIDKNLLNYQSNRIKILTSCLNQAKNDTKFYKLQYENARERKREQDDICKAQYELLYERITEQEVLLDRIGQLFEYQEL